MLQLPEDVIKELETKMELKPKRKYLFACHPIKETEYHVHLFLPLWLACLGRPLHRVIKVSIVHVEKDKGGQA